MYDENGKRIIVSLREYIGLDNGKNDVIKIRTFCNLMKEVSKKIESEERNLIRINLDEISINVKTGEIIFPEYLFGAEDKLEKTMAGINTGISLIADRKSTVEHKRVSLALMILGWYVTPNKASISSDIEVLENFDSYMAQIPEWLRSFFINIFKKMDYQTTFHEYYDNNFTKRVKSEIKKAFEAYNLSDEEMKKINKLVAKETNKLLKEGDINE